jgi:hypothetical protein
MAGVIFVLEFLELFLVLPDEDLGFGEDAGLEVDVDDAGLAFGGGGTLGFASILTGGGDLLLSAHEKAFSGRFGDLRYKNEKGSPEGLPFSTTTLADELLAGWGGGP